MARFLRLTLGSGTLVGQSIAININHIVSITPETSERYPNINAVITVTGHSEEAYFVQETFDHILNNLPI